MARLKLLSRLQKVSLPMPNTQGRTPHLGPVGIQEHTHQCSPSFTSRDALRENNKNHCASKDQAQGTPKLQVTEITSMTVPPRVLHTMIITADQSPHYMQGQTVSVFNDAKTLWLPATVICQARHGSTWFKSLVEASTNMHMITSVECHPDCCQARHGLSAQMYAWLHQSPHLGCSQ